MWELFVLLGEALLHNRELMRAEASFGVTVLFLVYGRCVLFFLCTGVVVLFFVYGAAGKEVTAVSYIASLVGSSPSGLRFCCCLISFR